MRITSTLIAVLLSVLVSYAESSAIWQSYPAFHNATQVVNCSDRVYVLSDGSLYSYDDGQVTTYSKHSPLSSTGICAIAKAESTGELAIVYSDAGIDFLSPDGETVETLSDFKAKPMQSKVVNSVWSGADKLYLSTSFGIVVVSVSRREFTSTYNLGQNVTATVECGGRIWAATANGICVGSLSDNLLDLSCWKSYSCDKIHSLDVAGSSPLALTSGGLNRVGQDGSLSRLLSAPLSYVGVAGNTVVTGESNRVYVSKSLGSDFHSYSLPDDACSATVYGSVLWTACGENGLQGFRLGQSDGDITQIVSSVIPDSPWFNTAAYMSFSDGKLLITRGGIMWDRFMRPGGICQLKDGRWINIAQDDVAAQTGLMFNDLTQAVEDPLREGHFYAASAGEGVYEFEDYHFKKLHNSRNSGMLSIFPGEGSELNYIRANGCRYDFQHNLWFVNSLVKTPIRILKSDGNWTSIYSKDLEMQEAPRIVFFDSRGWAWIVVQFKTGSMLCLDYAGTVDDASDDRSLYFPHRIVNQDGNITEPYCWNCVAEDHDGIIWLGTSEGLFYVADPVKALKNGSTVLSQVKIPRNDGTNNADYLLASAYINDIAIDAANRKWIATTSGVYCVTPDGHETVHHFTAGNSPLPSDEVSSIAIDNVSGTVYMGTEKGIVSFSNDETMPALRLEESNVVAYPNPVTPQYAGTVTIKGLTDGAHVKIVAASGTLMAEGTSRGGVFEWNVRQQDGRRVASGMYYVLASTSDASDGIVSRIMVVR